MDTSGSSPRHKHQIYKTAHNYNTYDMISEAAVILLYITHKHDGYHDNRAQCHKREEKSYCITAAQTVREEEKVLLCEFRLLPHPNHPCDSFIVSHTDGEIRQYMFKLHKPGWAGHQLWCRQFRVAQWA